MYYCRYLNSWEISHTSRFHAELHRGHLAARKYLFPTYFTALRFDVNEIFPIRRCAKISLREIGTKEKRYSLIMFLSKTTS